MSLTIAVEQANQADWQQKIASHLWTGCSSPQEPALAAMPIDLGAEFAFFAEWSECHFPQQYADEAQQASVLLQA